MNTRGRNAGGPLLPPKKMSQTRVEKKFLLTPYMLYCRYFPSPDFVSNIKSADFISGRFHPSGIRRFTASELSFFPVLQKAGIAHRHQQNNYHAWSGSRRHFGKDAECLTEWVLLRKGLALYILIFNEMQLAPAHHIWFFLFAISLSSLKLSETTACIPCPQISSPHNVLPEEFFFWWRWSCQRKFWPILRRKLPPSVFLGPIWGIQYWGEGGQGKNLWVRERFLPTAVLRGSHLWTLRQIPSWLSMGHGNQPLRLSLRLPQGKVFSQLNSFSESLWPQGW